MCRGAGNAASAFGAALQVDSARTGATESLQHPAARGGHDTDGGGDGSEAVEGAEAGSEEETETAGSKGGSAAGGGVASGDSMRAELLALQLIECANEMEDHLSVQVPWRSQHRKKIYNIMSYHIRLIASGNLLLVNLREQVGFSPTA